MQILGLCILIAGLLYAAAILIRSVQTREELRREKGSILVLAPLEAALFILCSFGMPDYVLHTIEGKALGILDDERIPHTVVVCGTVPGAILAFALLREASPVDLQTLLVTGAFTIVGSLTGARLLRGMDGSLIRRLIIIALAVSLLVLFVRILLTKGESGGLDHLSGERLIIVGILCFGTGLVNIFGIPMKPTWTAIFLIAGMSPLAALTMVLFLGSLSPMSGGVSILRQDKYHRKMALCSVVFGSLGSLIGISFALAVPAVVLNILLVASILIAILLLRKA